MKYEAPDNYETGGGNWLTEPGTYHLVIIDATENPTTKSGQILDGFRLTLSALDGTVRDADGKFDDKDKTVEMMFWAPKLTDKKEGEYAKKRQGRALIATGLIDENVRNQAIDINIENAVGRQVIATLEKRDGKFLDLHYADIWHIDAPDTSNFPKNQDALKLIPTTHRRGQKSFENSSVKKLTQPKLQVHDNELNDL